MGSGEPGIEGWGRALGFSPFYSNASYYIYLVTNLLPLCAPPPPMWSISTVYIGANLGSERLGNLSKVAQ